MMRYDDENWIKVYTRNTAGWLACSWQARGLALEIARCLPKHTGELSLGRRGLEALAALLRAPWAEIAPFVQELLDDGRLVYDAERQVIFDPQHIERQNAISSSAARVRSHRARHANDSVTEDVTPRNACNGPRYSETFPSNQKKEKKEEKEKKEDPPIPPTGGGAVDEVWSHYVATSKRVRPRRRPSKPTAKERKLVAAALKDGKTVEDLRLAVDGLFLSPHHLGTNDRNTEYLELEYALRKPDTFIALAEDSRPSTPEPAATSPPEELVDPVEVEKLVSSLGRRAT